MISCEWIKAQELKYLASSFYNIGASLYNAGQVEKVTEYTAFYSVEFEVLIFTCS